MGHTEVSGSKPFWGTFIEAESRICIKNDVYLPSLIDSLHVPNTQLETDAKSSESVRHIVFANDKSQIQRLGSDHVTVILNDTDQFNGFVRPKRKFIPSFSNDPELFQEEFEQFTKESNNSIVTRKTELPIIRFDSPSSKQEAIIEGLYQVGVDNPREYRYSQPFLKTRYARKFREQNGLIVEIAGDRIITPNKTLRKIELEIVPKFPPNKDLIKHLEEITYHAQAQLKAEGHTTYGGKSNSKIMRPFISPDNLIDIQAIDELKARGANETIIFENNQNQSIAA